MTASRTAPSPTTNWDAVSAWRTPFQCWLILSVIVVVVVVDDDDDDG